MKKLLFILLICAIFIVWRIIPDSNKIAIVIPQGASARQIANILYEKRIIYFPSFFRTAAKLSGKGNSLRSGMYFISHKATTLEIIYKLVKGKGCNIKITIPEGFTARQIAERLANNGLANNEKFLAIVKEKHLEGYLFPETYFLGMDLSEQDIIDRMIKEFHKHFTPEMHARAQVLKMTDYQILILASIIEKEAIRPEERSMISAVFYNRLKKGWFLESCATVLYALGTHKNVLTNNDLQIESPYNTYRHYGLPPGPICNPGISSINASLYPSDTDNMFFVASSSGTHSFSRYYEEHLIKKRKNRKNRKSYM